MALLQDNANGGAVRCLFNKPPTAGLAPKGTWRAKLIDIVDKYNVERRKFDNPAETERVNLTQLRFGFRDRTGAPWTIDTRPMRISGNEKSSLFAVLKSILGEAPKMNWDYVTLKGTEVLLTVEHNDGKTMTFATIATISPLPADFGTQPTPPTQPAPPPAPVPQQPALPLPQTATPADGNAGDELPF